ncbi:hypothetical protein ASD11_04480 [Aeromicrobium sp. Root495]|nr:hypothetical protein ASD11_04480 [Aeromicrobium sp. Root495]
MEEAGCPIQASALYKIEKSGRRITVDELLGFSAAFELRVADLLRPREVVMSSRLTSLFETWESLRQESIALSRRQSEAFKKLSHFVQEHHADTLEPFFQMVTAWSEENGSTEAETEAIRSILLATSVPVEPFKKMEQEALEALAREREGRRDDGE